MGNLSTVACATWILMDPFLAFIATLIVAFTFFTIASNAARISKKFALHEVVRLNDLTSSNFIQTDSKNQDKKLQFRKKNGIAEIVWWNVSI